MTKRVRVVVREEQEARDVVVVHEVHERLRRRDADAARLRLTVVIDAPIGPDRLDLLCALLQTRAASRALRRGNRFTLIGNEGDFWVYAYEAGPKEIAIVVVNRGSAVAREVPLALLELGGVSSWSSPLGTGTATMTAGGNLQVSLGAGEAAIFPAK